jgi:hypothetical protein
MANIGHANPALGLCNCTSCAYRVRKSHASLGDIRCEGKRNEHYSFCQDNVGVKRNEGSASRRERFLVRE